MHLGVRAVVDRKIFRKLAGIETIKAFVAPHSLLLSIMLPTALLLSIAFEFYAVSMVPQAHPSFPALTSDVYILSSHFAGCSA